jgi:hypothetical protein
MGAALWLLQPWLAPLPPALALAALIALGGAVFLVLAQLSGALVVGELRASLARR